MPDTTPTAHNGIPIKIPSMHHFSPRSIDPKEFKQRQKEIKEYRRKGTTSAGPQSQILDGVTYEDLSLHKVNLIQRIFCLLTIDVHGVQKIWQGSKFLKNVTN